MSKKRTFTRIKALIDMEMTLMSIFIAHGLYS